MQKRTQEQADRLAGAIAELNGKLAHTRAGVFEATRRVNVLTYELDVLHAAVFFLRLLDIYESGEKGILYCTGTPQFAGELYNMKMGGSGVVTSDVRRKMTEEIGETRLWAFLNDVQISQGSRAMLFEYEGRADAVLNNGKRVSCNSINFLEWKGETPTFQKDDWIAIVNFE